MDTATQKTTEVKDHLDNRGDPYYAHRLLADDNARVYAVGPAPGTHVRAWFYQDGSHAALSVVDGPDEDGITAIYTANTLQRSFIEILTQPCSASDRPPDDH